MTSFARAASLAILVAVSVLAVASVRELAIGQREVSQADAASAKSDWPDAIAHARAAAEARVPGSPWADRGLRRLLAIAHDAEARGDEDTAVHSYGAIRTASLATRGFGGADPRWRATAEDGLARVAVWRKDRPETNGPPGWMLAALRRDEQPGLWALAMLSGSVLSMFGGLARLAFSPRPGRGLRIAQIAALAGFAGYAGTLLMN